MVSSSFAITILKNVIFDRILELETALLSDCDINVIRNISSQNSIPNTLRYELWQVCLGTKNHSQVLEDIFNLPEQSIIRQDCQKLVETLDNSSSERLSILSDLESIVTNFSRLKNCPYDSNNGWTELLQTLIHLNVKRDQLYTIFDAIETRYVPKYYHEDTTKGPGTAPSQNQRSVYMQPFHLLRLLLLYHDPEMCSYMDTLKLAPDSFASSWVSLTDC